MVDEIKELIGMLEKLPSLALWVIAAFWAYKVIFIGSIYGLIRFAIDKGHSWAVNPKRRLIEIDVVLDGEVMPESKLALISELRRLKSPGLSFIHGSDVDRLRAAIDKLVADRK
jgi:hypothetical protein